MVHSFFQVGGSWVPAVTLVIFGLTYLGIAVGGGGYFRLDRVGVALLGAIAMLALGCIRLDEAVDTINYDSILLLFGLMVIASQLYYAGFYGWMANRISRTLNRPVLFLGLLMFSAGTLSAFLNNDVIALAFTPVIIVALLRRQMNPIPFLIGLALSTNIGCALTLIGNAQNVLIGSVANLPFGGYMTEAAVPVGLSLTAAFGVVWFLGRHDFYLPESDPPFMESEEDMPFNAWRVTKGIGILTIIVALFVLTPLPRSLVALTGAGLLLCSHRLDSRKVLSGVDWQLLVLFIGLFVVTGTLKVSGLTESWIAVLADWNVNAGDPVGVAVITAVLSNLINNSAAVMLLTDLLDFANHPQSATAAALSNAFAGNLLLYGSLANIIVVQGAERFNVRISFWMFARYGIPTALISMGILILWLVK